MTTATAIIWLFFLLFTKHLIIDFPLQTPYQWMNKGKYGHPGGIIHAVLHGLGTGVIFSYFVCSEMAIYAAIIDTVVHYHIDWAKVNINNRKGWGPTTHAEYWTLLGVDQFLHCMTYLGLVMFVISEIK